MRAHAARVAGAPVPGPITVNGNGGVVRGEGASTPDSSKHAKQATIRRDTHAQLGDIHARQ